MITLRPSYYDSFSCIADACRHTCCAGWEIDIDDDSMAIYNECPDILCHIKDGSFVLQGEDERCPFLNNYGLCDLIIKYGEEILCDVCTEHPRFYNYDEDIEYIGLGLCCEAALDLILDSEDKFALIRGDISPEGEVFGSYPWDKVPFGIAEVNDYEGKISSYVANLYHDSRGSLGRAKFYLGLEHLDPAWPSMLEDLAAREVAPEARDRFIDSNAREFRNLLIYFLYRHMGHRATAADSVRLIAELCLSSGLPIREVARMYAVEIEYSDVNVDLLKEQL